MIDLIRYNQPQPLPSKDELSRAVTLTQFLPGGARWYALDDTARSALVALVRAAQILRDDGGEQPDLTTLFRRIAEHVPSLTQTGLWKPDAAKPKLPELWRNPLDGTALPNPFARPFDRPGQNALFKNDPVLADWLRRLAVSPYEVVEKLRAEEAERKLLLSLDYGDKQHDTNPWRADAADVQASMRQSAFRREHGDAVAAVWKLEAQPVALPWSTHKDSINRTDMGRLVLALTEAPIPGLSGNGDVILLAAHYDGLMAKSELEAAKEALERADKTARELRMAIVR